MRITDLTNITRDKAKELYKEKVEQIKLARVKLHKLQNEVSNLDKEIDSLYELADANGWELQDDPIIRV